MLFEELENAFRRLCATQRPCSHGLGRESDVWPDILGFVGPLFPGYTRNKSQRPTITKRRDKR
jgi:hypothetical protein